MNSGRMAKQDKIQFVSGLPKTRSGEMMRRFIRKVAEDPPAGEAGGLGSLGATSTLLDPAVVSLRPAWDDRKFRGAGRV